MKFITKKINEITSGTIICFMFENESFRSELFNKLDELSNGFVTNQINKLKRSMFADYQHIIIGFTLLIIFIIPLVFLVFLALIISFYRKHKIKYIRRIALND